MRARPSVSGRPRRLLLPSVASAATRRPPNVNRPLFARYPRLTGAVPHVALASLPTPVQRLEIAGVRRAR